MEETLLIEFNSAIKLEQTIDNSFKISNICEQKDWYENGDAEYQNIALLSATRKIMDKICEKEYIPKHRVQPMFSKDWPYYLFEMIKNAEYHGNRCNVVKNIDVSYKIIEETKESESLAKHIFAYKYLDLTVTDEGNGFDWKDAQEHIHTNIPSIKPQQREDSEGQGRGLDFIVKGSDKTSWNKKGNSITTRFYITSKLIFDGEEYYN